MEVFAAGLNHKTAPLEIREKLAMGARELRPMLHSMTDSGAGAPISEMIFVSTCNRVEFYCVAVDLDAGVRAVFDVWKARGVSEVCERSVSYLYVGRDAVQHLFRVAAGADSMVVGETEILGQLKRAYGDAVDAKACGPVLGKLFQVCFRVGKRARSETHVGRGTASLPRAGLKACRIHLGSLAGRRGLVVGAGQTATQAAEVLAEAGAELTIASRTESRAQELAARCHGRAVNLDRVQQELALSDFLVTAARAQVPVLDTSAFDFVRTDRMAPLVIVDFGVPRNVPPSVAERASVVLYTTTDLQRHVDLDAAERMKELPQVENIVAEEAERFMEWLSISRAAPIVTAVRERADRVRRESLHAFGQLSSREREILERFSQTFMNRLIHTPTMRLRECDPNTVIGQSRIDWTCSLFGIDGGVFEEPFSEEEA